MDGRKEEGRSKETKQMKTCSGVFFQGLTAGVTSTHSLVVLPIVMHSLYYLSVLYLYGQVHLKPSTSEFAETTLICYLGKALYKITIPIFWCYFT